MGDKSSGVETAGNRATGCDPETIMSPAGVRHHQLCRFLLTALDGSALCALLGYICISAGIWFILTH